jgi:hypothetical protein
VARHRSPRGRDAHQSPPLAATGRRRAGAGAHRSVDVQTPLRRGAAIVAVASGTLPLVGAASPPPAVQTATQNLLVEADPVVLQASMVPVDPEPDVVDATELVKAVQLAEQEINRRAEERATKERAARERAEEERQQAEAAASGPVDCGLNTSGLGRVKSHVRTAAEQLGCRFGEPKMHGVAGRAGTSDHPRGLAVDFMVNRATGDALAACALENKEALGIKYVIWEQRINHGSGWRAMKDRGSATANHFDHVHISFNAGGGGAPLRGC